MTYTTDNKKPLGSSSIKLCSIKMCLTLFCMVYLSTITPKPCSIFWPVWFLSETRTKLNFVFKHAAVLSWCWPSCTILYVNIWYDMYILWKWWFLIITTCKNMYWFNTLQNMRWEYTHFVIYKTWQFFFNFLPLRYFKFIITNKS